MGFLSHIGSALSDLGGALVGNYFNKKSAKRSYERASYMSSTAHQREVEDLRAAGLNPVLSALGSGASTVMVPEQSSGPDISKAGAAIAKRYANSEIEQGEAAAIKLREEADLARANASSARAVAANQAEQARSEAVRRSLEEQQLEKLARMNRFMANLPPELRNQAVALEMFGSSALSTMLGQGYAVPSSASSVVDRLKSLWNSNWNWNKPASKSTSSARKVDALTEQIWRDQAREEKRKKASEPVGARHIDYEDLRRMKKPIKGPVVIHFNEGGK